MSDINTCPDCHNALTAANARIAAVEKESDLLKEQLSALCSIGEDKAARIAELEGENKQRGERLDAIVGTAR